MLGGYQAVRSRGTLAPGVRKLSLSAGHSQSWPRGPRACKEAQEAGSSPGLKGEKEGTLWLVLLGRVLDWMVVFTLVAGAAGNAGPSAGDWMAAL